MINYWETVYVCVCTTLISIKCQREEIKLNISLVGDDSTRAEENCRPEKTWSRIPGGRIELIYIIG